MTVPRNRWETQIIRDSPQKNEKKIRETQIQVTFPRNFGHEDPERIWSERISEDQSEQINDPEIWSEQPSENLVYYKPMIPKE